MIPREDVYLALKEGQEFTGVCYSAVEEMIENMSDLDNSIIRFNDIDQDKVDELWYIVQNVVGADVEYHNGNDIIISGDLREFGHELNYNVFMSKHPCTDRLLYQFLKRAENDELGGYKIIKENCDIETKRNFGLIQKIHSKLLYLSNKYYKR